MRLKLVVKPYKNKTIIDIGKKKVGKDFIFIAGPCSVESKEQLESIVNDLVIYGVDAVRGGAFKPRTSPYSFQGLGVDGLKILKKVCEKYDLPSVSEVLDVRHLSLLCKYVDIIQIGARNMYNYPLLREVGKLRKP
ncbi:MAG TPA: 3-deoxy-7-phosphoheptulonate synthase, partial [Chromatiaceae bacterium]|nr:3-deoxy-7-phosphoheptulonate synthase [Chromatiaceae bacterium]